MDAWGDGLGTGPMAAAVTRSMGRSAAETKDDTAGEGRDPVVSSEGDGSHLSPEVVEVSIPAPDGPLNDNDSVPPDLLMTEQAKDTFVLATKAYLLEGASAVSKILNKRKQTDGEPEYLVLHADGNEYWTPRSHLVEYASFITEYENSERVNKGLPPLRRSPRLAELDTEPTEVFEF
ncbi:hypothetical protein DYB35_013132 [Aphanomyces astaci]|uniref:Chromo domain-containing protein n=1 Tax=Aphanomyces astaci TaxID=112090 RepID=A0A418DE81_APHAT|nr:hypothetical protein DYB35_013132 [Aphanomyces astaci]